MPLTTTVHDAGAVRVATLSGEIDVFSCHEFTRSILDEIDAGNIRLALDLGEVTFIDSTGIGALVAIRRRAQVRGGNVVLAGVSPLVKRSLSISGLDQVFSFADAVDDAVIDLRDTASVDS